MDGLCLQPFLAHTISLWTGKQEKKQKNREDRLIACRREGSQPLGQAGWLRGEAGDQRRGLGESWLSAKASRGSAPEEAGWLWG